jgi:(2Fe-2S) ferredoxin
MSPEIRDHLKEEVEKRGWKPRVRVSQSGCLGLCAKGPNVMLYPQGVCFSGVTLADADEILDKVATFLK